MTSKKKKFPKWEAVLEKSIGTMDGHQWTKWTVRSQFRKNGSWYTVVDVYATPSHDAKENAEHIAKLLNLVGLNEQIVHLVTTQKEDK